MEPPRETLVSFSFGALTMGKLDFLVLCVGRPRSQHEHCGNEHDPCTVCPSLTRQEAGVP